MGIDKSSSAQGCLLGPLAGDVLDSTFIEENGELRFIISDIQGAWLQNLVREKLWDGKTKLIPINWLRGEL